MDHAMPTLLHVAVSPRTDRSRSRRLAAAALGPLSGWHILTHDLGASPAPQVTEGWIAAGAAGAFIPDSDRLIADLKAADALVISTPIYNWGVPAALKAWIDQISRDGHTFHYDANDAAQPYKPGLKDIPVLVAISSAGGAGYAPGGAFWGENHVEPYLRTLFGILGLHRAQFTYTSDWNADEAQAATDAVQAWAAGLAHGARHAA
jgi:FMN-dependent NADH-azoreductase